MGIFVAIIMIGNEFVFFICSQGRNLEYGSRKLNRADARKGYSKRKDIFALKRFLVRLIILSVTVLTIIKVNISSHIK